MRGRFTVSSPPVYCTYGFVYDRILYGTIVFLMKFSFVCCFSFTGVYHVNIIKTAAFNGAHTAVTWQCHHADPEPGPGDMNRKHTDAMPYRVVQSSLRRLVCAKLPTGRLKMREWKMRYGQNCKGGKCKSKPYGTPTRYYIETAIKWLPYTCPYSSDCVNCKLINCDFYCNIKIVAAFVYWWIVSCGIHVCIFW